MRRCWPGVFVALLAVAAFLPGLTNGLIEDDVLLLGVRLSGVAGWGDVPRLAVQSYWGDLFEGGLWRPLTLVVLACQKLAFGSGPFAFHVVSLLLHVGCSLLVLRLANGWLDGEGESHGGPSSAVAVAALFAVHPIHAEAVITIYGQADLWAAFFALLALVLDDAWWRAGRPVLWWGGVAAVFLVSLGFKESAILLPVGIWLLAKHDGDWRPDRRTLIVAGVWAVYLPLRWGVLGREWSPAFTVGGNTIGAQFVAAGVAIATDLRLMLLPWGQTIYYGHLRDRLAAGGTAELVGVVASIWICHWAWHTGGRAAQVGIVLLATFLFPVANIVPIGTLVAERALYLPSVGFLLILVAVARHSAVAGNFRMIRRVGVVVCVVLGLALSWRVCHQWRDERAAWENTLADHPRSARAAAEVVRLRLADDALANSPTARREMHELLDRALAINPQSPRVYEMKADLARRENDPAAADYAATARQLAERFGYR